MRIVLISFFICANLFAAEVLKVASNNSLIAVSHDVTRRWQVNDKLCVIKDGKEVACGTVIKTRENFVILKLKAGSDVIGRGDKVMPYLPSKAPKILIGTENVLNSIQSEPTPFYLLSMGGTVGPGLIYPSIHFQRIIDPLVAVGFMPSYLNVASNNKSLSSLSLLLTANFYPKEFFKELWILGGAGIALMSSNLDGVEQQTSAFQFLLTVGYRVKLDFGLVLGFGLGGQYLQDPNFSSLDLKGTGFKPIVIIDAGVNF